MKGLVRNISFEQADTVLILRFGVAQAATVAGVQTGDRTIEITVSTGQGEVRHGGDQAADVARAMPPFLSRAGTCLRPIRWCFSNMPTFPKSSAFSATADRQVERRLRSDRAGVRFEQSHRQ